MKAIGTRTRTHLLNSVSERHDHAELIGYVESWKARHVDASVDVLSG